VGGGGGGGGGGGEQTAKFLYIYIWGGLRPGEKELIKC
jgi:hypothetical protein